MKVLHRLGWKKKTLISAGDIDSQSEKDNYFFTEFFSAVSEVEQKEFSIGV